MEKKERNASNGMLTSIFHSDCTPRTRMADPFRPIDQAIESWNDDLSQTVMKELRSLLSTVKSMGIHIDITTTKLAPPRREQGPHILLDFLKGLCEGAKARQEIKALEAMEREIDRHREDLSCLHTLAIREDYIVAQTQHARATGYDGVGGRPFCFACGMSMGDGRWKCVWPCNLSIGNRRCHRGNDCHYRHFHPCSYAGMRGLLQLPPRNSTEPVPIMVDAMQEDRQSLVRIFLAPDLDVSKLDPALFRRLFLSSGGPLEQGIERWKDNLCPMKVSRRLIVWLDQRHDCPLCRGADSQ